MYLNIEKRRGKRKEKKQDPKKFISIKNENAPLVSLDVGLLKAWFFVYIIRFEVDDQQEGTNDKRMTYSYAVQYHQEPII